MNNEEIQQENAPSAECYDCGWTGLASETKCDTSEFIKCPKCGALSMWDDIRNK